MSCLFTVDICAWINQAVAESESQPLLTHLRDDLLSKSVKQITFVQSEVQKHQAERPSDARLMDIIVAALVNSDHDFSTFEESQLQEIKSFFSHNLLMIDKNPRMRIVPVHGFLSALVLNGISGVSEEYFTTDVKVHIASLSGGMSQDNLFGKMREFASMYKTIQSQKAKLEQATKTSLEYNSLLSDLIDAQDVRQWSLQDREELKNALA